MDHTQGKSVTDAIVNKYTKPNSACIHFKYFEGFSPGGVAHERWLKRLAETQAQQLPDDTHSCKGTNPNDVASSSNNAAAPRARATAVVRNKAIVRKPYKPRVLSKAPPRHQPSVRDALQ
jgi:hypothetical protein